METAYLYFFPQYFFSRNFILESKIYTNKLDAFKRFWINDDENDFLAFQKDKDWEETKKKSLNISVYQPSFGLAIVLCRFFSIFT